MIAYKVFETKRLLIRPTTDEDSEFIFELVNTPSWIKNIGDRKINSVGSAKDYIVDKIQPQFKRLGYSSYTILRKSDKVKVGTCGLYDREGVDGIDIGFALLPEFERNGFAFEAASKIKYVAFSEFWLKSISVITAKHNTSSQKLLERLGLKRIGKTKLPNENEELLLYKIEK